MERIKEYVTKLLEKVIKRMKSEKNDVKTNSKSKQEGEFDKDEMYGEEKQRASKMYNERAQKVYRERLKEYIEQNGVPSREQEAILYAQAYHTQIMVNPDSARFPSIEEFSVSSSYVVAGYVEGNNAYGAKVRGEMEHNLIKKDGIWICMDKYVDVDESINTLDYSAYADIIMNIVKYGLIAVFISFVFSILFL